VGPFGFLVHDGFSRSRTVSQEVFARLASFGFSSENNIHWPAVTTVKKPDRRATGALPRLRMMTKSKGMRRIPLFGMWDLTRQSDWEKARTTLCVLFAGGGDRMSAHAIEGLLNQKSHY
jgi:hypothetical protein